MTAEKLDAARAEFRRQFERELAVQLGTSVDALPTSVTKEDAAVFLGLKNPRTLNVWSSTGRHGIAMLKIGQVTRPLTSWLIDMKVGAVRIASEAA